MNLDVNGERRTVDASPQTPLLAVLRNDLGLNGAKYGCGQGQYGYCISGMIMTASAFLAQQRNPDETAIRAALDNNLCRCGTHNRILRAVQRAARELA